MIDSTFRSLLGLNQESFECVLVSNNLGNGRDSIDWIVTFYHCVLGIIIHAYIN